MALWLQISAEPTNSTLELQPVPETHKPRDDLKSKLVPVIFVGA